MRTIFHFLIFSNLWVAMCALVMSFYSFAFFHLPIFSPFLGFVFFATLCSYTFHLYLSTGNEPPSLRMEWVAANKRSLLLFFLLGLISSLGIGFYFLMPYYQWIIPLIFLTFLYSAPKIPYMPFLLLRGFGLGKTFYVSIVWTIVTVALPFALAKVSWEKAHFYFFANRFLLILSVCILFDFKDRHFDSLSKIKNMVTYFDERKLYLAFALCTSLFGFSTFLLFRENINIKSLIICILPEIFLLLAFPKLKSTQSDEWYYGYLDGILMLSGIILNFDKACFLN